MIDLISFSCCKKEFDLSSLISDIIMLAIGISGIFLALHFDKKKSERVRQYKVIDDRNFFRINVISYLNSKLYDLDKQEYTIEEPALKNVQNSFLVEIIQKFDSDFLSGTLLDDENTQQIIENFKKETKELLTTNQDGTLLKLRELITELNGELRVSINISKEKKHGHKE